MSVQAMSWALKMGKEHELTTAQRMLLLCMANYADQDGENIFPSNATLQDDTGLSERSVRASIRFMETLGLVAPGDPALASVKIKRADARPRVYRLVLDDAERHSRRTEALSKPRGAARAPRSEGQRGAANDANGGQNGGHHVPPILKNHQENQESQAPSAAEAELEAGEGRLAARPNEVTAEQGETPSRGTVQASSSHEGAGAHESAPQHLAEVVALKSAVKAREAPSRDPRPVVDLDLGRQLRESIRKRRELKTVAGAK